MVRRIEEQKKLDLEKAGAGGVAAAMPTTLAMLLAEFMKQHAEEKLAPKTRRAISRDGSVHRAGTARDEHDRDHAAASQPRVDAVAEVRRPHAQDQDARAMKPKTVRNIAGLVSSAFVRAIKWGLATTNPVTHSDLPKVRKRIGMALLPSEQDRLTQCATGPWCLPVFLDVAAATGARRGEVLALRWSDIKGMDSLH